MGAFVVSVVVDRGGVVFGMCGAGWSVCEPGRRVAVVVECGDVVPEVWFCWVEGDAVWEVGRFGEDDDVRWWRRDRWLVLSEEQREVVLGRVAGVLGGV